MALPSIGGVPCAFIALNTSERMTNAAGLPSEAYVLLALDVHGCAP